MGVLYGAVGAAIDLSAHWLSQGVEQTPVMDPSGSDQLFTKTVIRGTSIINPTMLPAIPGEAPGDTIARIRHYLTLPRQPLVYTTGSGTVINLPGGLDDANGPKPVVFSIQEFTPVTFVVSWAIEVNLTDCGTAPPSILSLRWTDNQTWDRRQVATRRRNGFLIMSSRSPTSGDDYRGVADPGCPEGFRRESSAYGMADASGLSWKFEYVDKQLDHQPPFPALVMRGGQIESIPLRGGLRKGELVLSLEGAPGTDSRDLLQVGVRMALARINASNPFTTKDNKVMMGGSIRESLDDDNTAVDLRFEWNMNPPTKRINGDGANQMTGAPWAFLAGPVGLAAIGINSVIGSPPAPGTIQNTPEGKSPAGIPTYGEWVGKPLVGASAKWPGITLTRGLTDQLRIVAAILRDPCLNTVSLSASSSGNELIGTTEDGASVTVSQLTTGDSTDNTISTDDDSLYVDEDLPGTWDFYKVTAHYNTNPGVIVLGTTVPGTKSVAVQTKSETKTLRLEWSLTRLGGQPKLPFEDFTDPNWVIVSPGNAVSVDNADVASDGVSLIYRAAGVTNFAAIDPAAVKMEYPIPPFLDAQIVKPSLMVQIGTSILTASPLVGP